MDPESSLHPLYSYLDLNSFLPYHHLKSLLHAVVEAIYVLVLDDGDDDDNFHYCHMRSLDTAPDSDDDGEGAEGLDAIHPTNADDDVGGGNCYNDDTDKVLADDDQDDGDSDNGFAVVVEAEFAYDGLHQNL